MSAAPLLGILVVSSSAVSANVSRPFSLATVRLIMPPIPRLTACIENETPRSIVNNSSAPVSSTPAAIGFKSGHRLIVRVNLLVGQRFRPNGGGPSEDEAGGDAAGGCRGAGWAGGGGGCIVAIGGVSLIGTHCMPLKRCPLTTSPTCA